MAKHPTKLSALWSDRRLADKRHWLDLHGLNNGNNGSPSPSEQNVRILERHLSRRQIITPVLIDQDSNVIAGRGLAEAAIRLGVARIPAYRLEDLTVEDLAIYATSLLRFAVLLNLDREVFLAEANYVRDLADDIEAIKNTQTANAGHIPA